jgi:hypothetical protein
MYPAGAFAKASGTLRVIVQNELRMRLRRTSTWVVFLLVAIATWSMIPEPSSGMALISVKQARLVYSSSVLAFGSAALASIFFGLGSFYLNRGRFSADLRCGVGGVIAASAVSNSVFLAARWLGAVLYMQALILALLLTTWILHSVRGEGPIELTVYLQTYALVLLPLVMFGASMALLFDSVVWLMGKAGDVLYFFVWVAQFVLIALLSQPTAAAPGDFSSALSPLLALDFSGLATGVHALQQLLGSGDISIGVSEFNAALPTITLPSSMWTWPLITLRVGSGALACLPMLLALLLFHRYSPDRVTAAQVRVRGTPLALANRWLQPLSRQAQRLLQVAMRFSSAFRTLAQVLADLALTLISAPTAILAMVIMWGSAPFLNPSALGGAALVGLGAWGVLISGVSSRDFAANLEPMTGAVPGGAAGRYLSQMLATSLLGFGFVAPIATRWLLASSSMQALALLASVLSLSASAMLLGRLSRSGRSFLCLFLLALYLSLNARGVPLLDLAGANGSATVYSIIIHLLCAFAATLVGYFHARLSTR